MTRPQENIEDVRVGVLRLDRVHPHLPHIFHRLATVATFFTSGDGGYIFRRLATVATFFMPGDGGYTR